MAIFFLKIAKISKKNIFYAFHQKFRSLTIIQMLGVLQSLGYILVLLHSKLYQESGLVFKVPLKCAWGPKIK